MAPGIGIGIGIGRGGGGTNWSSYWTTQPEVLFFGLYSEISGGQMPNKVEGSSDFVTVAGSVGSETYQCPNTAPYITADTDHVWFKADGTQRTLKTSYAVGFDFARTIVKYDSASPHLVRAILILSSDLETSKENKLRTDFSLSLWGSGVLSAYGELKENRGIGRSVWPEYEDETFDYTGRMAVVLPALLSDLINKTILDLKTADIYSYIDVLRLTVLHTEQASLLNVKSAIFGNGINNGLAWAAKLGFKGTGLGAIHIDSDFNPLTQGVNYTRDNAFHGGYVGEEVGGTNSFVTFLSTYTNTAPRGAAGNSYRARCYTNNTGTPSQNAPATSIGLTIASRVLSTHCGWYKNGAAQDNDADASVAVADAKFMELNGAGGASYAGYVQCTIYGGGIDATKHLALYNILKYFMDNVGGTF